MKKIRNFIILLLLIGAGIVIYMMQKGHDLESILNTPDKIDLSIECSELENLIVSATTNVTVSNISKRTHENITILVTGYDKNGNITKQKESTFIRTLGPKGEMMKPIVLPAKTVSCDCIIIDSNPQ